MKLAKYREIAQKIEALILNTDKRVAEIQGAEMYAQDYKDQQIGKIKEQAKAEMEALLSSLKTQYQEDQKDLKFPYSEDYAKRQYEAVAVEQELRGLNAHQVLEWYQEMAREGDPIKRGEADRLILARLNREAPGLLSDFKRIRVKSLNPDETKFEATRRDTERKRSRRRAQGAQSRAEYEAARQETKEAKKKRLLEFLEANPETTNEQAAEHLGLSKATIKRYKSELRDEDLL